MGDQRRDIGRFHGAQLIGQGGFGSVYQATDAEHGRQVAIKVLHGALGERERRRFDRERQTMGRLSSHPNIMPVHESGYTSDGEGYIVMDLASGGSLGARINRGELLGWGEAATIAVQIAGAAQAAHDQGILHRDIKPDNILIDAYGNPRLTDFGIAWVAGNATTTANTTATIAHAAPEVLEGQTSTEAVDIYAIASTFFHLVVGRSPFQRPDDEGIHAIITRVLTQPPPDLGAHGVPTPVVRVIERALAKQPGMRQSTAADLARELRDAVEEARRIPAVDPRATAMAPIVHSAPDDTRPPAGSAPGPYPGSDAEHARTVVTPMVVDPTVVTPVAQPGFQHGAPHQGPAGGPAAADQSVPPAGWIGSPGQGSGHVARAEPGGGPGRSVLIPVLAVVLVALVGLGLWLIPGLSAEGDGDADGSAATDTSTSESVVSTTAPSTSTTESATTTTEEEPDPTTTEAATTTSATTEPEDGNLVPVGGPDGVDCDDTRFLGYDDRWLITICASDDGTLSYHGYDNLNDRGIDLPACQDDLGLYRAANQGTSYIVDPVDSLLEVYDPEGESILSLILTVEEAELGTTFDNC